MQPRTMFMKSFYCLLIFSGFLLMHNSAEAQVKKKVTRTVIKTKTPLTKSKTVIKQSHVKDTLKMGTSRIIIRTDSGTMIVKLYDRTPLHRDNFLKLVQQHFYDSLLFHRVIPEF